MLGGTLGALRASRVRPRAGAPRHDDLVADAEGHAGRDEGVGQPRRLRRHARRPASRSPPPATMRRSPSWKRRSAATTRCCFIRKWRTPIAARSCCAISRSTSAAAPATGPSRRSSTRPRRASRRRSAMAASCAACPAAWIPRSPRRSFITRIGDRLQCIFVDNGLLRLNEAQQVVERYKKLKLPVHHVDATDTFLDRLADVTDPEQKRKIIGRTFIDIFNDEGEEARRLRLPGAGHALSRRHRVGLGARSLGHDQEPSQRRRPAGRHEVQAGRAAARAVQGRSPRRRTRPRHRQGIPRPPAVPRSGPRGPHPRRITRDKLALLQKADAIVADEVRKAGWYERIWQSFAVLLPVQSVGVMGDARTYEFTSRCARSRASTA